MGTVLGMELFLTVPPWRPSDTAQTVPLPMGKKFGVDRRIMHKASANSVPARPMPQGARGDVENLAKPSR
jgi:hypothetical protein